MTNDLMLGGVYILMAIMLVLGRADGAARAGGEAAHDGACLGRDLRRRLRPVHVPRQSRLGRAAAEGRSGRNAGPAGPGNAHPDGDRRPFLGRRQAQRHDVKFLVDSGATTTTIDRDTAKAAGVEISPRRDQFVRTGNGVIRVASGRADELERRRDHAQGCRARDRRQRRSQRPRHELSVVPEPLGRGRAMAGAGLLISSDTLHNAYYHTFRSQRAQGPLDAA